MAPGASAIVSRAPAPTAGWNTRDALTDMPADTAVILDNYFPLGDKVELRRGYASFATGMSGNVDTLMVYTALSGTQVMLACADKKIYDVTSGGAVGTAKKSSLANNQWQYTNLGTSGGQFLFCCNGADTPQVWSGSSFADATMTGPTLANVIACNVHQRRLWLFEKDKLSGWYGGTDAITGAFTEFPFYGVAARGGYIMGMATWTRDGGSGPDDVAVFVTSEGEAILYSGTDPASASSWALVGIFQIGKPIGRRFYIKIGGDLILVTTDGIVSADAILRTDRVQSETAALSAQIGATVSEAVSLYSANYGWQPVIYPAGKMVFVNVPTSATVMHQYVFNALTRAPCRFTGMNARCWAVCGNTLYFGGTGGVVYKADYGTTDNGANITGDIFPAFSYFASPGLIKAFKMVEVVTSSESEIMPTIELNTDFVTPTKGPPPVSYAAPGTAGIWGTTKWGGGVWGGSATIFRRWRSVVGVGRAASLRVRTSTNTIRPSLVAINYAYSKGGILR